MEINNRTHQISKSSVYDKLKKMALMNEKRGKAINLGRLQLELLEHKIQVYSENYPKDKVVLLEYNNDLKAWFGRTEDAGQAISETIQLLVKKQIYKEMNFKLESLLVLKISIEVWITIDSWAN